jgi:uncharacterized protein YndB with AHSA1/START domain
MTTTLDIKQEIVVKAPRAKVWSLLTTPNGWTGWFSEGVRGNFNVGETLTLTFEGYGDCEAIVVERDENNALAYKWHPGEDGPTEAHPESEMTTVRFSLEDHPQGTLLTMVESGFERVPEERRAKCAQLNTRGWEIELGELKIFAENGHEQALGLDEIVRERTYRCSPETLWDLISTPAGLKKWFIADVDGNFEPGTISTLHFSRERKVSGPINVLESRRPELFKFKWHPGQENGCTWDQFPESEATTTTFTVRPADGGAHLKIVETGFKAVPKERRTSSLLSNNQGWSQCLDLIEEAVG